MDKIYLGKFKYANGGLVRINESRDISVPDLRRVVIKKAPSWKKS